MRAIIFPGQGAQYVGMGKDLYDNFPKVRELFSSLDSILGFKLSDKCFKGPEAELKDTSIQQLAILAVSLAAFEVLKERSIKFQYLAGLSLGEYSCLYVAEVLALEEVVLLVKMRAKAMQEAASKNPSLMFAVIGLDREALEKKSAQLNFYIANINSPQQIVISLAKDKKQEVRQGLEAQGARVIELAVSGGFHSPFMNSAKEALGKVVQKIRFSKAKIPIVSNVTAKAHIEPSQIRENLLQQLTRPVLWNDCIEFMIKEGIEEFFEVGPSKILRGLMRKINPEVKVVNIEKKQDLEQLESVV